MFIVWMFATFTRSNRDSLWVVFAGFLLVSGLAFFDVTGQLSGLMKGTLEGRLRLGERLGGLVGLC